MFADVRMKLVADSIAVASPDLTLNSEDLHALRAALAAAEDAARRAAARLAARDDQLRLLEARRLLPPKTFRAYIFSDRFPPVL